MKRLIRLRKITHGLWYWDLVIRIWLEQNGEVVKKKASLVCKGYAQEEGIDYGETFSHVAILKRVRT